MKGRIDRGRRLLAGVMSVLLAVMLSPTVGLAADGMGAAGDSAASQKAESMSDPSDQAPLCDLQPADASGEAGPASQESSENGANQPDSDAATPPSEEQEGATAESGTSDAADCDGSDDCDHVAPTDPGKVSGEQAGDSNAAAESGKTETGEGSDAEKGEAGKGSDTEKDDPKDKSKDDESDVALREQSAEAYVTSLSVDKQVVDTYGKVRVSLSFSDGSPGDHVFHNGDTISVIWPTEGDATLKAFAKVVPLVAPDGVTYATATVSSAGATITFNGNVDAMYDVAGSLWFEAIAVNTSDTAKDVTVSSGGKHATVTVGPGTSSGEVGEVPDQRKLADESNGYDTDRGIDDEIGDFLMWLDADDPTYCMWNITFNENRHEGFSSAVTITDSVGRGQELDLDYMKIYSAYGDGDARNVLEEGTVAHMCDWFNGAYPGSSLNVSDAGKTDFEYAGQAGYAETFDSRSARQAHGKCEANRCKACASRLSAHGRRVSGAADCGSGSFSCGSRLRPEEMPRGLSWQLYG